MVVSQCQHQKRGDRRLLLDGVKIPEYFFIFIFIFFFPSFVLQKTTGQNVLGGGTVGLCPVKSKQR
jgi:hypothetical protein